LGRQLQFRHPREYWGDASPWLADGTEWDGVMNYNGFTAASGRSGSAAWTIMGNAASINGELTRQLAARPPARTFRSTCRRPGPMSSVRTTRSGSRRAAVAISGRPTSGSSPSSPTSARPAIYYGDEYGMQGGNDPDNRRTFDWTQATTSNTAVAAHAEAGSRSATSIRSCGRAHTRLCWVDTDQPHLRIRTVGCQSPDRGGAQQHP